MELREVESSNIKAVGFDEGLVVQYKSGVKYKYKGVTQDLYEEFLNAESKGKFMNSRVKGNFEFEKLDS